MNSPYGLLINKKDILLHRNYFKEFVKLLGIQVKHCAPRNDKEYSIHTEAISNYYEPVELGCIFQEHPDQKTMHKLGWASELSTDAAIISVPYDLEGLQKDSLFYVPSGFDNTPDKCFRVIEISGIMIYPASLTCKLVPEFSNTFSPSLFNHKLNSFNLLNREE